MWEKDCAGEVLGIVEDPDTWWGRPVSEYI